MLLMGSRYTAIMAGLAAFLSVPALAQFEVSPDHFEEQQERTKQVSPQAQKLQTQITEQKALLANYQAQIDARTKELEAMWNDVISTWPGDEAGQVIAFLYQQA